MVSRMRQFGTKKIYLLVAFTTFSNSLTIFADTPQVQIKELSVEKTNEITWSANAAFATNSQKKFENKIIAQLVAGTYVEAAQKGTRVNPIELLKGINELKSQINRTQKTANGEWVTHDQHQLANTIYDLAGKIPKLGALAGSLKAANSIATRMYENSMNPSWRIEAQLDLKNRYRDSNAIPDTIWNELYRVGNHSGIYKGADTVINAVFSGEFHATLGDSAKTILDHNPQFDGYHLLRNWLDPQKGTLRVELEGIKSDFSQRQLEMKGMIDETNTTLNGLVRGKEDILDYLHTSAQTEAEKARREAESAIFDTKIEGIRSSVFLLSTVGYLFNENLGKTISAKPSASLGTVRLD